MRQLPFFCSGGRAKRVARQPQQLVNQRQTSDLRVASRRGCQKRRCLVASSRLLPITQYDYIHSSIGIFSLCLHRYTHCTHTGESTLPALETHRVPKLISKEPFLNSKSKAQCSNQSCSLSLCRSSQSLFENNRPIKLLSRK